MNTLLQLGQPSPGDWPNYVEQYALTLADIPQLIEMATDKELSLLPKCAEVWAPMHAWRALGQLEAGQAIRPLIQTFEFLNEDDWALSELPTVFAMLGPQAMTPLIEYFQQGVQSELNRIMALDGIAEIAKTHPEQRDRALEAFRAYMSNPDCEAMMLNGLLMAHLLDLEATEIIDDIRHIFSLGCVDIATAGDLEHIEIELGLRIERSTPEPNYALDKGLLYLGDIRALDDDDYGTYEPPEEPHVRSSPKVGRNEPCPCGSGKKYKKCCGQ